MYTILNLKIKDTNDAMRRELKDTFYPHLKNEGWSGKGPHFRRIKNEECQTLDVQFNKYGKSFAINLSLVKHDDKFFTLNAKQLRSLRSQRLGTRSKRMANKLYTDHWFKFIRGFIFYFPLYGLAAKSVLDEYQREADEIFKDMQEAVSKGVTCIYSSQ